MNLEIFKETLNRALAPADLPVYLKALWWDAKGDWDTAHELIQDVNDEKAAWIHAYLHRAEGDLANADYWYRRAGRQRPSVSLKEEWESMATELIDANQK